MSSDKKYKSNYTIQQYKFVSELLWGSVPVDRSWAENTPMFKEQAPKLLEKYPQLDKSFFEEYEKMKKDGSITN